VVASRLLATAAFLEGRYVQAFPNFGLERRGAPVTAFARIDDSPIIDHSQIYKPDAVVVLETTLLDIVNVTEGLKDGGFIVINTDLPPEQLKLPEGFTIGAVNAGGIAAARGLGSRMSPIVNTAILGAFARATGYVSLESAVSAITKSVSVKPDKNIEACRQSYEEVRIIKPQ